MMIAFIRWFEATNMQKQFLCPQNKGLNGNKIAFVMKRFIVS